MKILIAEDDPVSRLVLEDLLSDLGYDVVSCSDGEEAWDELKQKDAPELAIIDWMMPGIDGLELCRRLRESSNPGSPYVMLLTVKARTEDKIEGLQAGADDYITKPFNSEEMRARVRVGQRIIDLQRQRIEQEAERYVDQLEQMVEELRQSRSRIVEAQENVRQSIAEELHGSIQTQMMMIYMRLNDVAAMTDSSLEDMQKELGQIAEDLDSLRENELRQISHRLHPSIVRLNLCASLRSLRDQYEQAIPIDLDLDDEVQELEASGKSAIPLNVRLGLYRVAEEAIGNAIKHSGASSVELKLYVREENLATWLCLSVSDEGKGFTQGDENKRSLGLLSIRDYMDAIGGHFHLNTNLGEGTNISAFVPLDIEQAADEQISAD